MSKKKSRNRTHFEPVRTSRMTPKEVVAAVDPEDEGDWEELDEAAVQEALEDEPTKAPEANAEVEAEVEEEPKPQQSPAQGDQKDYYPGPVNVEAAPAPAAMSFADLDAARAARQQAYKLGDLTYDLRMLIDNVLASPDVEDKKVALDSLVSEFATRAKEVKQKSTFWGNPVAWLVEKAKMTRSSINDLPDSDFAYIEPGGKKDEGGKTVPRSLRHFPIHDAAHVRNALARAPQSPFGSKAMPKIRAAAKKFGIEVGKEYLEPGSLMVMKSKEGTWRWLGIFTNNYQDRSKDILTEAAHKEYCDYLDAHPTEAPLFCSWHELDLQRKARADFWDYNDGFFVMSGALTEEEAAGLAQAKETYDLGMSHLFFPLERDPKNPKHIMKYRTVEVSDLPIQYADNPWTALDVILKEADMSFKPEKREYFAVMFGEEVVKGLEKTISEGNSLLQKLNVAHKEATEETPTAPETIPVPVAQPATKDAPAPTAEAILKELDLPALNVFLATLKASGEAKDIEIAALKTQVADLATGVQATKKSQDEQLAELIRPPINLGDMIWKKRASQSADTVLKPEDATDETLAKSVPKSGWLEEALAGVKQ